MSIANFALSSGWYDDAVTVLTNLGTLSGDYDEYYQFWGERAASEPSRCQVIDYENLSRDFSTLPQQLHVMGIEVELRPGIKYGKFAELNMSPANRAKVITQTMVEEAMS